MWKQTSHLRCSTLWKLQKAGVRWIYYLGNSPVVTQKDCDILFILLRHKFNPSFQVAC